GDRKSGAKEDKRDARQLAEAFLTALAAGKIDDAAVMRDPGQISGDALENLGRLLAGKAVRLDRAHAAAKDGLAVTAPLLLPGLNGFVKQRLVVTLARDGKRWVVRAFEAMDEAGSTAARREFLKRFPESKPKD
ncbi:MAG: hypothetical protein L0Z62_35940, partial [Gemmataceae bacterium]|nr:hypothetical protein [Gemmataceae bacterium]